MLLSRIASWCALVWLCTAPLLAPLEASAQEGAGETATAAADPYQQMIAQALSEFDQHNYEEAYALFTQAHALRPSARTERALGKTTFELRRYLETVRWLEASLVNEVSPLTPEMRTEVEELLVRTRAFLGTVVVRTDIAGARLELDHEPVEGDPSSEGGVRLELVLGTHEVSLLAEGYQTATRRIDVRGGENGEVSITLIPVETVVVVAEDPGGTIRDLGYAGLVTGALFAVMGAISISYWADSVSALNLNLDAGLCYADPNTENVLEGAGDQAVICQELEGRYRLALPLAWVGFVGAGVFLGAGLGMVLGAPGPDTSGTDRVTVSCGPFADIGMSCGGTF
jgi:hypothetical protein